jgi:hypothetical protein
MKTSKVKRLKSDKLKRAQFRCLPSNNLLLSWEHGTYSIWELDTKKDTDELQLLCQGLYTGYSSVLFIHHDSVVISYYRPKDGNTFAFFIGNIRVFIPLDTSTDTSMQGSRR